MTEAEAKRILTEYGAPVNIAKHIEAINTAIRALGKRGYDEILAVLGRQDHDGHNDGKWR